MTLLLKYIPVDDDDDDDDGVSDMFTVSCSES